MVVVPNIGHSKLRNSWPNFVWVEERITTHRKTPNLPMSQTRTQSWETLIPAMRKLRIEPPLYGGCWWRDGCRESRHKEAGVSSFGEREASENSPKDVGAKKLCLVQMIFNRVREPCNLSPLRTGRCEGVFIQDVLPYMIVVYGRPWSNVWEISLDWWNLSRVGGALTTGEGTNDTSATKQSLPIVYARVCIQTIHLLRWPDCPWSLTTVEMHHVTLVNINIRFRRIIRQRCSIM